LASISRSSGVSTADLMEWNGLSGAKLKPGHRIWISAPSEAERSAVAGLAHASVDSTRMDAAETPETPRVSSANPLAPDHAFRHRVRHGETLDRIAGRYGVTTEQIRKWNDLTSERIKPGSRLWIGGDDPSGVAAPVASRSVEPRRSAGRALANRSSAAPEGPAHIHVVRQGETLEAISHQYSVPTTSIVFVNHLRNTRIDIGQKLVIPGQVAQAPAATTRVAAPVSAAKVRTVNYIVRLGDSLYSIARARATTVDTLMVINGLTHSKLKPGQVILVPLASAR
jgi:LysM repeat protein